MKIQSRRNRRKIDCCTIGKSLTKAVCCVLVSFKEAMIDYTKALHHYNGVFRIKLAEFHSHANVYS